MRATCGQQGHEIPGDEAALQPRACGPSRQRLSLHPAINQLGHEPGLQPHLGQDPMSHSPWRTLLKTSRGSQQLNCPSTSTSCSDYLTNRNFRHGLCPSHAATMPGSRPPVRKSGWGPDVVRNGSSAHPLQTRHVCEGM